MRESFVIGHLQNLHGRLAQAESKLQTILKVLEEIVGKELMRGQALHKVLMDKAIFTDAELKVTLEKMVADSKAELEKAAKEVQEEKAKAVEILVPAGANLTPPVDQQVQNQAPAPTSTSEEAK